MAEQELRVVADEDQRALASTAGQFFREHSPIERVRRLRDTADPNGFSRDLWARMAEMGYAGLHLPEAYGGMGMSFFDLALVLIEGGRTLVPEPFVSTVLAGETLAHGGSDAQKDAYLYRLAAGECVVAAALSEATRTFDLGRCETTASAEGEHLRLRGTKLHVVDGVGADAFLVTANSSEGTEVFLVPADAEGVRVERQVRMDGRNVARVAFDGVLVEPSARLPGGLASLRRGVDLATVALAAEMLGGAEEVFSQTVEYIKVRKQFGVPLGSFQALQHRAARVYIRLQLCRSAVLAAARAVDDVPDDLVRYASLAKAQANDAYLHAVDEAVQMHGGVGVTDECNVGFYLKRARVAAVTFGDSAYHRARFATFNGY